MSTRNRFLAAGMEHCRPIVNKWWRRSFKSRDGFGRYQSHPSGIWLATTASSPPLPAAPDDGRGRRDLRVANATPLPTMPGPSPMAVANSSTEVVSEVADPPLWRCSHSPTSATLEVLAFANLGTEIGCLRTKRVEFKSVELRSGCIGSSGFEVSEGFLELGQMRLGCSELSVVGDHFPILFWSPRSRQSIPVAGHSGEGQ